MDYFGAQVNFDSIVSILILTIGRFFKFLEEFVQDRFGDLVEQCEVGGAREHTHEGPSPLRVIGTARIRLNIITQPLVKNVFFQE